MIRRRHVLAGFAAFAAAPPAFALTPVRQLFDGHALDGWDRVGDANWRVEGGALAADRGGISFLVSRESFRDFELSALFWVSPDANSGIFLRCQDRATITVANSYEVNIFDRRPDPTYGTGAIVDVAPVSPLPQAGGRWNAMTVRAEGDRLSVTLNGRTTVAGARDSRHREGPVALQYGAGAVRFRQVALRLL